MEYTYGSEDVVLLASAARTAALNSNDVYNKGGSGLIVVIDITAYTSGSITVTIQGKDQASGKYYTILASAALGAAATTVLRVSPILTGAANTIAKDLMPHTYRVSVAVADATPITYSIGCSLVP